MSAERLVEEGNAAFRAGDEDEAMRKYEAALAADPAYPRAHFNLGVVLQSRDDFERAIGHYRAALKSNPAFAPALVNLANAMRQVGNEPEAVRLYSRALELDALDRHALMNLVNLAESAAALNDTALARDAYEAVAAAFQRRLAASPGADAEGHFNLGVALQRLERLDQAISHYAAAVADDPVHFSALLNWGEALRVRGDVEEARSRFEAALGLQPMNARALNNLATLALDCGDLGGAKALFERAAAGDPAYRNPHFNFGVLALHRHEFAVGWEGYEERFAVFESDLPRPPQGALPFDPAHAGEVRRLAVPCEQGIGDQILFSTLLPELAALEVDADIEVDERLIEAYSRSLPALRFVAKGEAATVFEGASHVIALGSLPRLFRPDIQAFARQPGAVLQPDPERMPTIERGIPQGTKIGISWRTFQRDARRHVQSRKSIPLEEFFRLGAEGRLLDLQYGDAEEERRDFDARHPGLRVEVPGLDRFHDLEGMLAAISACDCVVTSSNVTAHLAGAIGKRTYLVYLAGQPTFHYWSPTPDGRSLWYPSVEVVTNPHWHDWAPAFDEVLARLRSLNKPRPS